MDTGHDRRSKRTSPISDKHVKNFEANLRKGLMDAGRSYFEQLVNYSVTSKQELDDKLEEDLNNAIQNATNSYFKSSHLNIKLPAYENKLVAHDSNPQLQLDPLKRDLLKAGATEEQAEGIKQSLALIYNQVDTLKASILDGTRMEEGSVASAARNMRNFAKVVTAATPDIMEGVLSFIACAMGLVAAAGIAMVVFGVVKPFGAIAGAVVGSVAGGLVGGPIGGVVGGAAVGAVAGVGAGVVAAASVGLPAANLAIEIFGKPGIQLFERGMFLLRNNYEYGEESPVAATEQIFEQINELFGPFEKSMQAIKGRLEANKEQTI